MEGLTEGRIVHFVTDNGQHHAAIVAKVWSYEVGTVNLAVFDDNGVTYPKTSVRFAETGNHEKAESNTWHWIERA